MWIGSALRASIAEYLAAVMRWWWIVVVTVLLALIGLSLDISGDWSAPGWLWILIGALGLPIAQFLAYHSIRSEVLPYRTQPKFEWKCREEPRTIDFWYVLVGVRHIEGATAKNCVLRIVELLYLPTGTRPTGFNPETIKWRSSGATRSEEVAIDIRPSDPLREATLFASPTEKPPEIMVSSSQSPPPGLRIVSSSVVVPSTRLRYPPGEYLACVQLIGENLYVPVRRWFHVSISEDPSSLAIHEADAPSATNSE